MHFDNWTWIPPRSWVAGDRRNPALVPKEMSVLIATATPATPNDTDGGGGEHVNRND
jgi:hypothetical protein